MSTDQIPRQPDSPALAGREVTPTESKTPRTDQFIEFSVRTDHNWRVFARQLEIEISELQTVNKRIETDLGQHRVLVWQLLDALEAITYKLNGLFFTSRSGDTDVTDYVGAAIIAAKTFPIPSPRYAHICTSCGRRTAEYEDRDCLGCAMEEAES